MKIDRFLLEDWLSERKKSRYSYPRRIGNMSDARKKLLTDYFRLLPMERVKNGIC